MQFQPHEWPTPSGSLRYMTPYVSGQELLPEAHPSSYAMAGLNYPGGFFSPWTIMTDDEKAIVIWASNWPPKTTMVMHGGRALETWYQSNVDPLNSETPVPGETRTYRYTMRTVAKAPGSEPWHLAVDAYNDWLNKQPIAAFDYPEWIRNVPGIYSYGLQNLADPYTASPYNLVDGLGAVDAWKAYFPWVSFWGQMSGMYGSCCTPDYSIHSRYLHMASASGEVSLLDRVQEWTAQGLHIGFYSAPKWDQPAPFYLTTAQSSAYLYDWMNEHTTKHGANAYYIDTLARDVWGPAMFVADMFALSGQGGLISANTMIEGAVDVMPAVYLLAGGIHGCDATLSPMGTQVRAKPELAAYALANRIAVYSDANGDHVIAGPANNYLLERQTLLLGAKFSSSYPPGSASVLMAMMDARAVAHWYEKRPRYRDRRDLGPAPAGIDVRVFSTNTAESLLVFDNPSEASGTSISHKGHSGAIPATKFGILSD